MNKLTIVLKLMLRLLNPRVWWRAWQEEEIYPGSPAGRLLAFFRWLRKAEVS